MKVGFCTWPVDYQEEIFLVATPGAVVLGAVCGGSGYEVQQLGSLAVAITLVRNDSMNGSFLWTKMSSISSVALDF